MRAPMPPYEQRQRPTAWPVVHQHGAVQAPLGDRVRAALLAQKSASSEEERRDLDQLEIEEIEVHQKHLRLIHDQMAALSADALKTRAEVGELRSHCVRSEAEVASWRGGVEARLGDLQAACARAEARQREAVEELLAERGRGDRASSEAGGQLEALAVQLAPQLQELQAELAQERSSRRAEEDAVASRQRLLEERLRAFEDLVQGEIQDRAAEYRRLWGALHERAEDWARQAPSAPARQDASPVPSERGPGATPPPRAADPEPPPP
ncbi:unnamed protein product, partial [Prorocentrum cordatum]